MSIFRKKKKSDILPSENSETTVLRFDRTDYTMIGKSSVIGSRKEQQDTILTDNDVAYLIKGRCIAILCDGMGGMNGGGIASQLCTSLIYSEFYRENQGSDIRAFYERAIAMADKQVSELTGAEGAPLHAGTTLVSVVIDDGRLYVANVGDSHGYLIRDQVISQITEEHNLMALLMEDVACGRITLEDARSNPKREALISYIGMGGLRCCQISNNPLKLLNNDTIILCSDGLYRSVSDDEILQTVCAHGADVQSAADELTALALSKGKRNQDNTSVVVVRYAANESVVV